MNDNAPPRPARLVPIVGRIVDDGRVEPLGKPGDERTPQGLARQDTLKMGEAWAKFPAPEVAPYKPPKTGKPWWRQPPEER